MSGTFDQLNDALFAQMSKLQDADLSDEEQARLVIDQTKQVSALASRIIENHATAISLMRFQREEGMDGLGMRVTMPRMLGGGE